ncbi:MAG: hypothetical protein ACLTBV_01065 [Enterocloster bolteae]
MAERQESRLKRNLTFWNLMGVAIGQIIGAGIVTMTGTAVGMTGTGVALALYDIAGADTDNRLSAGDTEQLRACGGRSL